MDDATASPDALETCDGQDDDCDGSVDESLADADADGLCDALDLESCDGLDNDGDGLVDEGWPGADGDGFGGGEAWTSCTPPEGYVSVAGDCDDDDPDAWPGAPELCDGRDNDCDPSTADVGTDADGDGWYLCDGSGAEEDCDDADPTIHPGAEELCDGKDNNCNGEYPIGENVDGDGDGRYDCRCSLMTDPAACEAVADCNDDDPDIYAGAEELCDEKDNDCNGIVDDGYVDADGDGFLCSDCDDTDPATYPGAPETWDGRDNDCDGVVDDAIEKGAADFCVTGTAEGDMLYAGASPGDLDGDGLADVLVHLYGYNPSEALTGGGGAGLYWGGTLPSEGEVEIATDADVWFDGVSAGGGVYAVGPVGDIDDDGSNDLVFLTGDPDRSSGASSWVYIFGGGERASFPSHLDLTEAAATLAWTEGLNVGDAESPGGDMDGDGHADLVFQQAQDDHAGTGAGAACLYHGLARE